MNFVAKFFVDYILKRLTEYLGELYENYIHKKKLKRKMNEIIKTSKTREERSRRVDDFLSK